MGIRIYLNSEVKGALPNIKQTLMSQFEQFYSLKIGHISLMNVGLILGLYKQINGYSTSWALGAAFALLEENWRQILLFFLIFCTAIQCSSTAWYWSLNEALILLLWTNIFYNVKLKYKVLEIKSYLLLNNEF